MKKFLSIFLLASMSLAFVENANAQESARTAKSITAVDTITFSRVQSHVKRFEYNITKTSGTLAGKVYLEASVFGSKWTALDSITLADNTNVQQLSTAITATSYLQYRFRNTNTSSAAATVSCGYLRRSDE